MTSRQQTMLMAGGIAVAVLILAQLFFLPLYDSHVRARRALTANQRILKEIIPLGMEYRHMKQNIARVDSTIAARGKDFHLFSYVEKRTGDAAIKPRVKYINPLKAASTGPYEEAAVDVKLEMVTLKQLMGFIYLVESPVELIKVRNISITKNREKMEYLNATLQVITYVTPKGDAVAGGSALR